MDFEKHVHIVINKSKWGPPSLDFVKVTKIFVVMHQFSCNVYKC